MSRKSSDEWSALIREFEKSGLEHVAFCAPRGINVWTFRRHLYDVPFDESRPGSRAG